VGAVRHVLVDMRVGIEHPADEDAFKTWPLKNVWVGVTAEDQKRADERIPVLLKLPAAVRFLSCEPLRGPINLTSWLASQITGTSFAHGVTGDRRGGYLDLSTKPRHTYAPRIDWCISGGESGHGARPMHPDWARSIRDQCVAAGVAFHFKQWGEFSPFVDEAKYTHGGSETKANAQTWLNSDGRQGECWIYDDDGSWTNWTGAPGRSDDVAIVSRVGKAAAGRELDGRTWDEFPEVAR
jgi:protein gp37